MIIVFMTLIGALALEPEGASVTPMVFCLTEPVSVVRETKVEPYMQGPIGIALTTPDDRFLYLADTNSITTIPRYWQDNPIIIHPQDQLAVHYENGQAKLVKAFEKPGEYIIHFSDNLETEPENALWLDRKVTLLPATDQRCRLHK